MSAINSEGLLRLEREIDNLNRYRSRPNFLRALGGARSEIKHSNFLAFLMDPSQKHQLSDRFLKAMLNEIHEGLQSHSESLAGICNLDLTGTEVYREYQDIDILLLNPRERIAIIIENKTGTGEHDGQLQRYWKTLPLNIRGWIAGWAFSSRSLSSSLAIIDTLVCPTTLSAVREKNSFDLTETRCPIGRVIISQSTSPR